MADSVSLAPRASVIVCTHNNSATLREAVASILDCAGEAGLYEIIVVDNRSSDDTSAVVARLIDDDPPRPLRYVREDRLGLHHARHTGARAARGSLLLYTDDDVEVDPHWVQAFVDAFDSHPEMAAAGGPALPRWEADPPRWLDEIVRADLESRRMCSELSLIDLSEDFTAEAGAYFGLNMAIRYDALAAFGGFQPDSFGSRVVGAGEWGLYWVMQRAGALIGYVPQARVWHRIPAARMRPEYFERWAWHGGAAQMFQRWRGRPRTARALASDVARIVGSYWKAWLRLAYTRRRPDGEAVRARSRAHTGFGELAYLWWMASKPELRRLLDAESYGP